MSVSRVAPAVRQTIHLRFCQDLGTCKYVGGPGNRRRCDYLDELLDHNDEMLLHNQALEFEAELGRVSGKRGAATLAGGLGRAIDMTDPFEVIGAFDEHDEVHPGEERPDCPSCVKGIRHYHRKSDGSPVRLPQQEAGT